MRRAGTIVLFVCGFASRKTVLIVMLIARIAKKQDNNIKVVLLEMSIFITKSRLVWFLELFFIFSAYS